MVHFQGKPFNITVIQVYVPTTDAKEAEVEWFCEELQDLLELISEKDALFITGDCNAKVGSQETPGMTGKFGLAVQNINRVLSREHAVQRKIFPTTHETMLHMDVVNWRRKWQPTTVFWTQGHH